MTRRTGIVSSLRVARNRDDVSLSRSNHGQPGVQAHPEVVQGTAELHHEIADALLPQADPVFHNTTTLDAAVDMLDPEPPLVERLVGQFLLQGQLPTAWLLRRHEDLHLGEGERQEAQILQQPTRPYRTDAAIRPHLPSCVRSILPFL